MTEVLIKRIAIAALLSIIGAVGLLTFFSIAIFALRGVYDANIAATMATGGLAIGFYAWRHVNDDLKMIHGEIEALEEKKPGTARRLELTGQIALVLAVIASVIVIVILDKHFTPPSQSVSIVDTDIDH